MTPVHRFHPGMIAVQKFPGIKQRLPQSEILLPHTDQALRLLAERSGVIRH